MQPKPTHLLVFPWCAIALFTACAAQAAPSQLSLADSLSEATANSPSLQKSQAAAEEAEWARVETWSGFLPKLQLTAGHVFDYKLQYNDVSIGGGPLSSIPLIFPTSQLSLQANLPLFDGFANINAWRAGRAREDAAHLELDWTRFQLEHDVSLRYFEAVAAARLVEVTRQNLKTLEEHNEQISARIKAGTATQFDRLRVEVQINEARSEVLKAEDDLVISRRKLANAIGIASDDRTLSDDLPQPRKGLVESLAQDAAPARADLQAAASRVEALDRASSAQSTHWVPRLSLGGNYLKYNNRSDTLTDWSLYRDAYQIGFFLTWNLFDGLSSTARSREVALQRVQAEKALEQTRLQADTDFAFWKRRYLYSLALFEARTSDAGKAQESVRLARIGYRAGTLTSTEVLDAELDLFRSRAGVIQAQLGCAEALLKLELALGRKI